MTELFPYCGFPFARWNPVQEKCAPFLDRDCNLVVAAPTASGKTAVAEAVSARAIALGRHAIYVSPLKALGLEKANRWREHPVLGKELCLLDGDHPGVRPAADGAGLVVATAEACLLACRKRHAWLRNAGSLVFDEAHLLGDESRGAISETLLLDFSELRPSARIVLLSGTLGNARELAEWLHALNGLPSAFVVSSWRPHALKTDVAATECLDEQAERIAAGVSESGKCLVFVPAKTAGQELCKLLRKLGVSAALYHAGTPPAAKERLLASFRRTDGGLQALVATSALAMGVDL